MPLSDRKLGAIAFEKSGERRVIPLRHLFNKVVCARILRGGFDFTAQFFTRDAAKGDVVLGAFGVLAEILEDDSVEFVQRLQIVLADVSAVEQDRALGGIVQARDQLDERGLARTVEANECDGRSRFDRQIDMVDDVVIGAGVAEADVAQFDRVPTVILRRRGGVEDGLYGLLLVHEQDHVIDEQRALIDGRGDADDRGQSGRNGVERARVDRIVGDLRDVGRDHVEQHTVHRRGRKGKREVPCPFLQDQLFNAAEIAAEHLVVLADQEIRQVEQAHFLDHVFTHEQIAVIVHLAAILGAAEHVVEVLAAEVERNKRAGKGEKQKRRKEEHARARQCLENGG